MPGWSRYPKTLTKIYPGLYDFHHLTSGGECRSLGPTTSEHSVHNVLWGGCPIHISAIDCTRLNMPVSTSTTESPVRTRTATDGLCYIALPYIKMCLNSCIWTKITIGWNILTQHKIYIVHYLLCKMVLLTVCTRYRLAPGLQTISEWVGLKRLNK